MAKSNKLLLGIFNAKFNPIARRLSITEKKEPFTENKAANLLFASAERSKLKMKGWQIHAYGHVDELQFEENLRIPQIRSANECLVKVHTTTVNPIDVAMLGGYGAQVLNKMRCQITDIEFPLTFGREFCGELVQCGMGVNSNVGVGDRVWGVVPIHAMGAHAEYVATPDYCLSHAPKSLSNEDAASVLYAGLTAWSGLYITGQLGSIWGALTSCGGGFGKRVLVLGGSGSVGSLAIQILKSQGSQVLATCSQDAVPFVRGLGAELVVDYHNSVDMQTLGNYSPIDIVLDCAGQGTEGVEKLPVTFRQYITFSSPVLRNIDSSGFGVGMLKNIGDLIDTNMRSLTNQSGFVKYGFFVPAPQGIAFLKELVERRKLLPNIDSSFGFKELPQAFERVQKGHLRGKVVVNLN